MGEASAPPDLALSLDPLHPYRLVIVVTSPTSPTNQGCLYICPHLPHPCCPGCRQLGKELMRLLRLAPGARAAEWCRKMDEEAWA